eukprot:TRINITY_DN5873_c1_g1_i1.p2 TRINITY_DN5873_c1_g1~~TRINITY_DN5873_c1_g1_i1.p2  ORF type:complete len:117 (-),score=18.21 TRINITY_DN5873_c1_g1_i1:163-513(-)
MQSLLKLFNRGKGTKLITPLDLARLEVSRMEKLLQEIRQLKAAVQAAQDAENAMSETSPNKIAQRRVAQAERIPDDHLKAQQQVDQLLDWQQHQVQERQQRQKLAEFLENWKKGTS